MRGGFGGGPRMRGIVQSSLVVRLEEEEEEEEG